MHHPRTSKRTGTRASLLIGLAVALILRGSPQPSRSGGTTALETRSPRRRRRLARLATTAAFVAFFAAGGALSALAGDTVGDLVDSGGESSAAADCTVTDSVEASPECTDTPTETSPGEGTETPGTDGGETVPPDDSTGEPPVTEPPPDSGGGDSDGGSSGGGDGGADPGGSGGTDSGGSGGTDSGGSGGTDSGGSGSGSGGSGGAEGGGPGGGGGSVVVDTDRPSSVPTALDPEATAFLSGATIWLHRSLPDPTPKAARLAPAFARTLESVSARHRVHWALVLGVVRAQGSTGPVPASDERLEAIAAELAERRTSLGIGRPWEVVLAFSGRTAFADRTVALARYNRAVGLRALVTGLTAAKRALISRVLRDERIDIYAGGREDVRAGRVDIRVLVLLRYLRFAHGSVTVSSLISGHGIFARKGVVSAHVYGFAVDISALGGVPIAGNQNPGGLTETAVRNVLLLPREVQPRQVISLLGLGGASFPLGDHGDHVHVGF